MKIDEACINHNAMRLIKEEIGAMYDIDINAEDGKAWLLEMSGNINGICKLAEELKKVLKE